MSVKGGSIGCSFLSLVTILLLLTSIPLLLLYGLRGQNAMSGSLLEKIGLQKLFFRNNTAEDKAPEYIHIEFNSGHNLPKNTIEAVAQRVAKIEGLSPVEIDRKEKSLKIELSRKYKDTKSELEKKAGSKETEVLNKFEQGNYKMAEAMFAEELARKKTSDLAAYHLGNIKFLEMDFMRAAFYYNQAVTLFPSNIKYLLSAGDAWKEVGNLGDALDYYQRAFTACRLKLGEKHETTMEIKDLMEEVKSKLPPSQADIYKKLANMP